jgi:hypothetical protein
MWTDRDFERLATAIQTYDQASVEELCERLVVHLRTVLAPFGTGGAARILKCLRRKRHFDLMQWVADAFLENGQDSAEVRKLYAQALVDRGQLNAAERLLRELVHDTAAGSRENLEARGLLGRVHKQRYVDAGGRGTRASKALNEAIRWYGNVFAEHPGEHWHGINAAACLRRAYRDGVPLDTGAPLDDARAIAESILGNIRHAWDDGAASLWQCASAGEACLVLEDHEDAATWYGRYAGHAGADAFEIASTVRQLEDVWELDTDVEPGAMLLPVLRAALLRREGGARELTGDVLGLGSLGDKGRDELEKVFGHTSYMSFRLMLKAIDCGRAVARIEHAEEGFGTGFLVRGSDLHEPWGLEPVLVTNAHVLSDSEDVIRAHGALRPDDVSVAFLFLDRQAGRREMGIAELLWTSPPEAHDVTVGRLDEDIDVPEPYKMAKYLPVLREGADARVYVVGHPRGGALAFSMQDNVLLDHEGPPDGIPREDAVRRLHYRAPTEGGSSGSPVFNKNWDLIGVHHAGGREMRRLNGRPGLHAANEAIWIQSVREAILRDLAAGGA